MVISPEQKKVLLERLQLAKAAKAEKAKAKKEAAAAAVKEPEPPAPAPAPAPAPVPEPAPLPVPPPVPVPEVPDLVAASKKPARKKKCFVPSDDDSDSEEEVVLPKKIKKGEKKTAYMKIKIYKEPKNAVAFQSLVEAIQDQEPEEEEQRPPPSEPIPISQNSIGRNCRFANANANNPAMKKGSGVVSHQELMRRAALEFFS